MGLQKFAFALAFMFSILSPTQDAKAAVDCAELNLALRLTWWAGSCFNYIPVTIDMIQIEEFIDQDLIDEFENKGYKSGDVYVDFELINVKINKQASCSDYYYAKAFAQEFFNAEHSETYRLSVIVSNKPISGSASQFTGYMALIASFKKSEDGTCQAREESSNNVEIARMRAVAGENLYVNVIFSAESGAGYDVSELVAASVAAGGPNLSGVFSQVAPFLDPVLNFDTSSETFSSRQTRIDAFALQANATTGLEVVITFGETEFARFKLIQKISEQGVLQDKTSFYDAASTAQVASKDHNNEYKPRIDPLRNILKIRDSYPNFDAIGANVKLLHGACVLVREVASEYQFSNLATRKLLALMMFEFYQRNGGAGLESSGGYNLCLTQSERNLYLELVKTAPQAPHQCPIYEFNPTLSHVRATVVTARESLDALLARGIVVPGELWQVPDSSVPFADQVRSILGGGKSNRCTISVGGKNSHGLGTPKCTYLTSMVRDDNTRAWVAFRSYRRGGQIEIEDVVIGADPRNYIDLAQPFTPDHPDCQTWWAEAAPAG